MSEDRRRHSWTMKRKYSCCLVDSDTLPRARLSAIKRTEAMGERNSWETLETKLVFSSLRRSWRWKASQEAITPISAANADAATRPASSRAWRQYEESSNAWSAT